MQLCTIGLPTVILQFSRAASMERPNAAGANAASKAAAIAHVEKALAAVGKQAGL
jgi:hypothetical protein